MTSPQHESYRILVQQAWADGVITGEELSRLVTIAAQLGVNTAEAHAIEREVMGQTKEEALMAGAADPTPPPTRRRRRVYRPHRPRVPTLSLISRRSARPLAPGRRQQSPLPYLRPPGRSCSPVT